MIKKSPLSPVEKNPSNLIIWAQQDIPRLDGLIEKFLLSLSPDFVDSAVLEKIPAFTPNKYRPFLESLVLNNLLPLKDRAFAAFILGVSLCYQKDRSKKWLGAEFILEAKKNGFEVPSGIHKKAEIRHYKSILREDLLGKNELVEIKSGNPKPYYQVSKKDIAEMAADCIDVGNFRTARNLSANPSDKEKKDAADFLIGKAREGTKNWWLFCDVAVLYENGHCVTLNRAEAAKWIILAKRYSPDGSKALPDWREKAFVANYGHELFNKGTQLAKNQEDSWANPSGA